MLWLVIGKPAFRLFWKLAALDRAPRIRRVMLEIALWADQPSHRGEFQPLGGWIRTECGAIESPVFDLEEPRGSFLTTLRPLLPDLDLSRRKGPAETVFRWLERATRSLLWRLRGW